MQTLENTQQEPTMVPPKWPENPWLSIWIQPRATIRAIVDVDPERYVLLLAATAGIGESLSTLLKRDLGDNFSHPLIFVIIFGSIGGVFSLYISSAILNWIGRRFGGEAPVREVRTAVAWSSVPLILGMLLWIPKLVFDGTEMFTVENYRMINQPWVLLCLGIMERIIGIWAFIVFLNCFGEVNGFSAWKALVALIVPGLVIAVLLICFIFFMFAAFTNPL